MPMTNRKKPSTESRAKFRWMSLLKKSLHCLQRGEDDGPVAPPTEPPVAAEDAHLEVVRKLVRERRLVDTAIVVRLVCRDTWPVGDCRRPRWTNVGSMISTSYSSSMYRTGSRSHRRPSMPWAHSLRLPPAARTFITPSEWPRSSIPWPTAPRCPRPSSPPVRFVTVSHVSGPAPSSARRQNPR